MFECNIFYVFRVMNKMSRVITVGPIYTGKHY